MARILVLDEHGVYRRGLCALISTQMPQAQVLAANSLIEALPQIQTGAFDLVLLGLDLSNSETADTLMGAREASAATRFVIISASDTRGDMLAALAAGLHGFISKHQSDAEILTAINDILSGRIYVPCSLAEGLWRGTRLVLESVAWSALAMSGARAEIKATDCSIAISGTTAFSSQTIHCLSEDQIGRVIDVLVSRGVILRAADAGLGIATVRTLAKRIKPTQQLDDVQAVAEVSHVVDVAMSLVAQGAQPSGDALIDETLRRVAERTKVDDAAGATRAAEAGFAQWEKEESARRDERLGARREAARGGVADRCPAFRRGCGGAAGGEDRLA